MSLGNKNNMNPLAVQGFMLGKSKLNDPPKTDIIVGQEEFFTSKTNESILGVLLPALGNK